MKSRAVLFTGQDKIEIVTEDVPDPGPGQILIQATCSLISTGTECICLQRKFASGTGWDRWVQYPFRPGYSLVGRVIKVGPGVDGFREGDRVTNPCSHQQYVLASPPSTRHVPDGVTDEQATWGTLSYVVQHGFRKANLQLGETVVVIGLGLLGQLLAQYAKAAGAGDVIAVDTVQKRLDMAAAHGATHTLRMPADQAVKAIADATGGAMAEVVFDMTGNPVAFESAQAMVRRFGRLILIGDTGTPADQHLTHHVLGRDLTMIGSHGPNPPPVETDYNPWTQTNMVRLFFQYLQRRQMRVDDMITHRFGIEQAADAYHLLTTHRDQTMAVVLDLA